MAKHIIDYIRQPDALDAQSLTHLRALVDKYPYYHAARILLLKTLYEMHDTAFDKELREAAIYLPSRKTLFMLFEAKNIKPENPTRKPSVAQIAAEAAEAEKGDLTEQLIGDFLRTMPEEQKRPAPKVVDATVDYMAYLLQSGSLKEETTASETENTNDDPIEIFLNENHGVIEIADVPDEELKQLQPKDSNNDSSESRFTEQLAHIYIKQGKFEKAKEIILRISSNNSKKNRYFADQIRFLDKLIINERNKKQ